MDHERKDFEQHHVKFEPPDLVTTVPRGVVTAETARSVWRFVYENSANLKRFYWMANISHLERYAGGDQGEDAKKAMIKLSGMALVGGSFRQRTLMSVLVRAARTLGYSPSDMQMEFFQDETAARAWIDSLRERQAKTSH